jgi:hypothetical protein
MLYSFHPTNPKAKNYVHDALEVFDVKKQQR